MIFKKDETGFNAFRDYCPYLSKSEDFGNLYIDIDNAEYMLSGIVGQGILDYAIAQFVDGFDAAAPPVKADAKEAWVKHYLVVRIQHAVAYISYLEYVVNRDVTHKTSGRKSQVDAKNERQAWEFMIERDNDGITAKMHLAINRLLQFLEANTIKGADDKAIYSRASKVLLTTLELFQRFYPIDDSRLLFMKLLPFQHTEQEKHLVPIIGREKTDALITAVAGGDDLDGENTGLLEHAGPVVALRTMAVAIKRLSIKLLPQGLVQEFNSSIQSRKSSMPVNGSEKDLVVHTLLEDAKMAELDLANHVSKLDGGEDYDPTVEDVVVPENSDGNKYFRV